MQRTRASAWGCGAALIACLVAVACGSRNGLDTCTLGGCPESAAGDGPLRYRYDKQSGRLEKLTKKAYKSVVAKAAKAARAHF